MSEKKHSIKCVSSQNCNCDGYHTFDELYEHRIVLFIKLCEHLNFTGSQLVWRSKLHHDGSQYDGWFIMGINSISGRQITYHLPLSHWEETNFAKTLDKAYKFDGHTSEDVLERLKQL